MKTIGWRLALLGLLGAASLVLVPVELLGPAPLPPMTMRILSTLQPALLVLLATALGLWAAPRVGLDAPLVRALAERRPPGAVLRAQLPAALAVALAGAAVLVAYTVLFADQVSGAAPGAVSVEVPLATRIFYGGIAEELMVRWGLMSLFVWIAWRLGGRREPVPAWCYWAGAALAALLFALGHLPVLYLAAGNPAPALVAAVIAGNALPGLLYGWLFWRRGLEAAMIAHALTHAFAAAVSALT